MKISGFTVNSDIVGRRMRISWNFLPEAQETVADIPPVILRRKLRDFAFPALLPDPYLVYDSSLFPHPPAGGAVRITELDSWEVVENGVRIKYEPVSVAISIGGRSIEILRRTVGTSFDAASVPINLSVEVLDSGRQPGDLQANTVYYYQLFSNAIPASGTAAAPYRSSALVTDSYGLNRKLYELLPEIYRSQDVRIRPITPGTESVPEQAPMFGQLRRFTDIFGIALDSMRGTAEGIRTLHDIDSVDARFLQQLAHWIGWETSIDADIPLQRNEIKAASRIYRVVGTIPGIRTLVSQYTGWFTQVAEFSQNLLLSNRPPERNLFAVTASSDGLSWHGVDDAAELLGFTANNQQAIGAPGIAATLTGLAVEPFALRQGMELTLEVDGLMPATLRFGFMDFADISQATAIELAQAIRKVLPEINADSTNGHIRLISNSVGFNSSLKIVSASSSLITLENAPCGRLSPLTDSMGRTRLFYEAWEKPTATQTSIPSSTGLTNMHVPALLRRIRYKTFLDGAWRDSHPMFVQRLTPQGDIAALILPDNRIWSLWIDDPQTTFSRLRFAMATQRPLLPARLQGQRIEPFLLTDSSVLAITGHWSGLDRYLVRAADFVDIKHAKAAELVSAMNAQFSHVTAAVESDGSIRIETVEKGSLSRLAVDLGHSTTARALGFAGANPLGSTGSWSEELDWSSPLDVVSVLPGRHADAAVINDPTGGIRLVWSTHTAGRWRINTVHWQERILVGTGNGLFVRDGSASWQIVSGLPSNDIRFVSVDSNGEIWLATANGVVRRHADGTMTPLAGLPSNDIRNIALAQDGSLFVATAAGVVIRAADNTLTVLSVTDGLPANDVRAIVLDPYGVAWIATGKGIALRRLDGKVGALNLPLASNDIRGFAVGQNTEIYIATALGIGVYAANSELTVYTTADGLGSNDVRNISVSPNGSIWAATARGVSVLNAGNWSTFDTGLGLLSNDVFSVTFGADGIAWIGGALGVNLIDPKGAVARLDIVGGGTASPAIHSINTGWSQPLELAGGGAGNREPTLVLDENKRIWLVWSQRAGFGNADESWYLRCRILDPLTWVWGIENQLTTPPAGSRAADHMPSTLLIAGGVRIFFSSDRNGGAGLWSVDVNLAGVAAPMASLVNEASSDLAPAPAIINGRTWLFYRSDRNVPLAQVGYVSDSSVSTRVPDVGTIRRYAGSTSIEPGDLSRANTRRQFGDLMAYTPNRPAGDTPLQDDELYTRATLGLYVSRASKGNPLTQDEAMRLRELLARFIPGNLRTVVFMVTFPDLENVFGPGNGIQESYQDSYPFVEKIGPISEKTTAVFPNVLIIKSNLADNVSANSSNLSTLRRRTWFPPLK